MGACQASGAVKKPEFCKKKTKCQGWDVFEWAGFACKAFHSSVDVAGCGEKKVLALLLFSIKQLPLKDSSGKAYQSSIEIDVYVCNPLQCALLTFLLWLCSSLVSSKFLKNNPKPTCTWVQGKSSFQKGGNTGTKAVLTLTIILIILMSLPLIYI